jgi:hypothetical protein
MKKFKLFITIFIFFLSINKGFAQNVTVFDVPNLNNPAPGYIFIAPIAEQELAIFDNSGHKAYSKNINLGVIGITSLRVLENGLVAFYGDPGWKWFIANKNFEIIDSIGATSGLRTNFHTFHMSPQGHYLLLADNPRVIDMTNVVPNGRPNVNLFDFVIQEFDENKKLVFQWDCYDHIDVRDATSDFDLTTIAIDPYHINQVIYDSDGNILVNFRSLDAIYKINRSNGNIMWIWGGSKSRRNQFTFLNDTINGFIGFSHQHDPKRLENGNILLFDNAVLNPQHSSRAVEYRIDETNKTATKVWEYYYPTPLLAEFMGNAQRLPNGNTFIGWGVTPDSSLSTISATEVTPDGNIALEFRIQGSCFYQALRYVYKMDAVLLNISTTGNKSFNDAKNTTGVSINLNSLTGSGFTSVEKHAYEPYNMSFTSTKPCFNLPYRWVINNTGITDFTGKLSFDLSTIPDLKHKSDLKLYWRNKENTGTFSLINATYNFTTNKLEADITRFGEFMLAYNILYPPTLTFPRDDTTQVQVSTLLKWSRSSLKEKYRLQVSTTPNYSSPIIDSLDIEENQFELSNLDNYTNYYWRLKVFTNACESNWTYSNSFRTIIGTPNQIFPVDNYIDQPLEGTIKWASVKGADKYKIQISKDTSFKKLLIDSIIANNTFYNYSNFQYNTNYFWRVSAGTFSKFGAWSAKWMFSTYLGKVALKLPVNHDVGIQINGNIEWNFLPVAKSYRVQLCKDTIFDDNIADVDAIKATTFSFSDLEKSTQYFWRVLATDNISKSEWSDIWRFWTIFPQPILQQPENNSTNTAINGQLTWKPVPTASTYKVQLSTDPDFINVIQNQETYYPIMKYSGLEFEKPYFWRVKAANGTLESDWSDIFTFSSQPKDLLLSPIIVYPKNEEFKIPLNPEITWNEAYSADSYDIQIATDPAFKTIAKTVEDITLNKYQVKDLDYNIFYYIKIRSKNAKRTSDWSNPIRFTTWLKMPKVIYPLDNDTNSVITNIFKWEETPDARYYYLQVAHDKDFEDLVIDQDNLENTQFDFTGMLDGVYYYWHVATLNNVNSSDWTPTGTIKMLLNVNVKVNLECIDSFSVYPIPVTSDSKVSLRLSKPEFVTLELINEVGEVLLSIMSQQLESGDYIYDLPIVNLSSGVYYCRLMTENGVMIKKLQIVK